MNLKSWKFWLGIGISGIFLYLFVKDINWSELWSTIKAVRTPFLVAMLAVNLSSFLIRALRWRYFFHNEPLPAFRSLFSATAIGFMANSVLPFRLGEIIRAVMLGRSEKISKSTCLGTLVIERLFDMLAILFFFAFFIIVYSLPTTGSEKHVGYIREINLAGYTSGTMCLIAILGLVVLRFKTRWALRAIEWCLRWFPDRIRTAVLTITRSFIEGLNILKDMSAFFISVGLSLLLWLWAIFQIYLLLLAFNLDKAPFNLGFPHAIFLLVIMAFSVMVPAAPGYVGTFHYGSMVALALMGVNESIASGVAIVGHAWSMFPIAFVGFYYLWAENICLKELQKQEFEDQPITGRPE